MKNIKKVFFQRYLWFNQASAIFSEFSEYLYWNCCITIWNMNGTLTIMIKINVYTSLHICTAQCMEAIFDALATSTTTFTGIATTMNEFLVHFWCLGYCRPHNFISAILWTPTPIRGVWKSSRFTQWLGPAIRCLICCLINVQSKSILSRWYAIRRSSDNHWHQCKYWYSRITAKQTVRLLWESIDSISSFDGQKETNRRAFVKSSNLFHTFHDVFLPLPAKNDTWSQPVIAWNKGIEIWRGPRLSTRLWIGI